MLYCCFSLLLKFEYKSTKSRYLNCLSIAGSNWNSPCMALAYTSNSLWRSFNLCLICSCRTGVMRSGQELENYKCTDERNRIVVYCNVLFLSILKFLKKNGAGNRIRTGDPDLGKVVLYQLSYSRYIPLVEGLWLTFTAYFVTRAHFLPCGRALPG